MASVFTVEALEQVVEHTAGYAVLQSGAALQAAGGVTSAGPASMGVSGTVQDAGNEYRVWAGIRQWMLAGECDCPDADPLVSSQEHLAAVAAGHAQTAGLCAHAVALALAAIEQQLPWATPPQQPRPGTGRGPRTTPPPPLDVTRVFPDLAAFARRAVRLHPRRGQPGSRDSSMGGPLLWPAGEPWPVCTLPHSGHGEFAGVPPEIASPMIGVLQLHARDVPALPFPEGTDCFQLLWCPNRHPPGSYPTVGTLHVAGFWRRAAAVTEVLHSPPAPRFDQELNARYYQALPCVLSPEPVTEYPSCSRYPDYSDLPEPLREPVQRWDDLTAGLYAEVLSVAPGTKTGGYPRWVQEADWPVCGCGRRMEHLLTIASDEWGNRMRWIPSEDRDHAFAGEHYEASFTRGLSLDDVPHGVKLGDLGSMYLFTCTTCPSRPLDGSVQTH